MISSRETTRAYQVIEEGIRAYFAASREVRERMPEDLSKSICLTHIARMLWKV